MEGEQSLTELQLFLSQYDLDALAVDLADLGYHDMSDLLWLTPTDIKNVAEKLKLSDARYRRFKNAIIMHENYKHKDITPYDTNRSDDDNNSRQPSHTLELRTKPWSVPASVDTKPAFAVSSQQTFPSSHTATLQFASDAKPVTDANSTSSRPRGWYVLWSAVALCTVIGQLVILIIVIGDLRYIFENIHNWPFYGSEADSDDSIARGVVAVGQEAYGILAIGQKAHGVFCIGQLTYGVFSLGQVGCGLIFALCQVGGGIGFAVGQAVVGTKVFAGQIVGALWKVDRAQLGFSIGASMFKKEDLIVSCHGDCMNSN